MIAAFIVPQKRDFISRDDAKIAAWTILEGMGVSAKHNERLAEEVDAVVDDIPAADVRPVVKAKWAYTDMSRLVCSNCGNPVAFSLKEDGWHHGDFCPNCGADMRQCPEDEAAEGMRKSPLAQTVRAADL